MRIMCRVGDVLELSMIDAYSALTTDACRAQVCLNANRVRLDWHTYMLPRDLDMKSYIDYEFNIFNKFNITLTCE